MHGLLSKRMLIKGFLGAGLPVLPVLCLITYHVFLPTFTFIMLDANLKSLVDEWLRLDPVSYAFSYYQNTLLTIVESRNSQ